MKLENQSNLAPIETDEFWQQHQQSAKLSGLSRRIYCHQHGLNYYRFGYWIKKKNQNHQAKNGLIPIRLKSEPMNVSLKVLCTLELKSGHCLKIHDAQVLAMILERYA